MSQGRVGINEIARNVRILRVEFPGPFVEGEGFLPAALPAPDGGDEGADVAVVRQKLLRGGKLAQRPLVIVVKPIGALAEGEMRFAQIRLQAEGGLRFAARSCFPGIERLVEMKDFRAGGGETGMGEGEVRIEFDRLLVELFGPAVILEQRVGPLLVGESAQVEIVGIGVLGRLLLATRTFSSGVSWARKASAISVASWPSKPNESASVRS